MSLIAPLVTMSLIATAPAGIAALKWEKRVLLVNAADARDPLLDEQRRIIAAWKANADDRDLAVVEILGNEVHGVSDTAAPLRRRYRLPAAGFAVVLIGKDGGAKLRESRPIPAATLQETIDAMPMRRDGQR